jgi:hypothetical protein
VADAAGRFEAGRPPDGRGERPAAPAPAFADPPPISIQFSPVVNVTNQLPDQAPPTVNVAPPEVTVNNEVYVPEAPAPTVNVTNEVKPADVRVELPPRKTETTVERDLAGNITRATQIETDLDKPTA